MKRDAMAPVLNRLSRVAGGAIARLMGRLAPTNQTAHPDDYDLLWLMLASDPDGAWYAWRLQAYTRCDSEGTVSGASRPEGESNSPVPG